MPERWDYKKAGVDMDRAFEVSLSMWTVNSRVFEVVFSGFAGNWLIFGICIARS